MPGCGSGGNATTTPPDSTTTTTTTTSTTNYDGQVIVITYSFVTSDEPGGDSLSSAPLGEGNYYILINLRIENHGYFTFRVNHYFFTIDVNGTIYTDTYLFELPDPLVGGDLHDGEVRTGNLAFEVPEGTNDFTIIYKYASSFNIQYIQD